MAETFLDTIGKALVPVRKALPATLNAVSSRGDGWFRLIAHEPYTGAWQRNEPLVDRGTVLTDTATFRCLSLIAGDVGKLRIKLVRQDSDGLWSEASDPRYSPVLGKPNKFQTRQQFIESWMISKLAHGNTFALKQRKAGVVTALHILDPRRVTTLVADNGEIYYGLKADNLSGGNLPNDVTVPASEIIHDRWNCLHHWLIGLSPITACGISAMQAQAIRANSASFFNNKAQPGGILTAPGAISDETAIRLKNDWNANFGGNNSGNVAVLGDGLTFQAMAMTAEASQLVDQLKMSTADVAAAFGVPLYKLGGPMPTVGNGEMLERSYYQQALQVHIEAIEALLDEGLDIAKPYGAEFDLDGLLRLDQQSLVTSLKDAVGAGIMAPDEARRKLDLKPVPGGSSPLMQQQNFSLEALAKRDALPDPFNPGAQSKAIEDDHLYPELYWGNEEGKAHWRELIAAGAKSGEKPRHRVPYIRKVVDA